MALATSPAGTAGPAGQEARFGRERSRLARRCGLMVTGGGHRRPALGREKAGLVGPRGEAERGWFALRRGAVRRRVRVRGPLILAQFDRRYAWVAASFPALAWRLAIVRRMDPVSPRRSAVIWAESAGAASRSTLGGFGVGCCTAPSRRARSRSCNVAIPEDAVAAQDARGRAAATSVPGSNSACTFAPRESTTGPSCARPQGHPRPISARSGTASIKPSCSPHG